jgi:hypothetical protein
MSEGTDELASLENDVDRLRIADAADVSGALTQLIATEPLFDRTVQLAEWIVAFPKATSQLLRVIANDRSASLKLASTVLGSRVVQSDDVDDVLATAFSDLSGPVREAAADRDGVRQRLGIDEGAGYESVRPPDPAWLWPVGKLFPSVETIAGVQARLNYLGLGAGPINGEWTEPTRRAFARWQVLNGFEPSGELDLHSIEHLALKTPDAPD